MTNEEYYAIVHKLRLTPTRIKNVYLNEDRETQRVPDPTGLSSDQIIEAVEWLIVACGRELKEFNL